jgi:hypothetical protein
MEVIDELECGLAPASDIIKLTMTTHDEDVWQPDTEERPPPIEDDNIWEVQDTEITVKLLSRRKDIREALVQGLIEAFPERFSEEDIPDDTIVDIMNMDAEVKTTVMELLLELTDCADTEGETSYYPSIAEYSCAEEILEIERLTGFRESREAIPYKYEHLSSNTLTLIYSNPHILPIISKMKKEQITDSFIRTALGIAKK